MAHHRASILKAHSIYVRLRCQAPCMRRTQCTAARWGGVYHLNPPPLLLVGALPKGALPHKEHTMYSCLFG